MKNKLALPILLLLVCFIANAQTPPIKKAKPKTVTGEYRLRRGELRNSLDVQQLPGGKIKFGLIALWVSPNNPENIHNGELHGEVPLANGVAVFESGTCRITMKFSSSKVEITESDENGDCGFGANVTAAGTYRKINSKTPKFAFWLLDSATPVSPSSSH